MKDAVFAGPSVEAALDAASRSLGVPVGDLRYVVLEQAATEARIAVLLEASARRGSGGGAGEPREELPRLVGAFADAAGLDVEVELAEAEGALTGTIVGPDCGFFLEDDGAVLEALELVLQRALGWGGVRVRLRTAGYREQREERLREMALSLAEAARADGRARVTKPLNSFERRIVHLVVAAQPGLRTQSEGEGPERRVRILPG